MSVRPGEQYANEPAGQAARRGRFTRTSGSALAPSAGGYRPGNPVRTPPPRWLTPAVKAGALVLVAVLSGVIWWATHHGQTSDQSVAGPIRSGHSAPPDSSAFQSVHGPVGDTDCARRSYGKARRFFERTPCTALSRQLFSSTDSAGRRVLTSVSTVTMPSPSAAAALKGLTDADGTGNVTDLVTSGVRLPGGPSTLKGSGYDAVLDGARVRIAESGFFSADGHGDNAVLKKVSAAALQAT